MLQSQPKMTTREHTQQQLILAAEKLFAESGIDSVSLRQINLEAGQKNSSAAHYHFGSKDALILSIYKYRMAHVNARRITAIKELEQNHAEKDIHRLIGAIVYPIVKEIDADESGRNYIRFMAQTMGHPQLDLAKLWQQDHSGGMTQIHGLLRTALPNIPEPLFGQRFGLVFEQIVHSLADLEKLRLSTTNIFAVDSGLFVNNLIDCVAGSMAAAISTDTRSALQRL